MNNLRFIAIFIDDAAYSFHRFIVGVGPTGYLLNSLHTRILFSL